MSEIDPNDEKAVERYESAFSEYKKLFNEPPPTVGYRIPIASYEYLEDMEIAVKTGRPMTVDVPEGANY